MQQASVAVIGSGSWATAIVKVLLGKSVSLSWWIREADIIRHLRQYMHNPRYLSSVSLDVSGSFLSGKLKEVVERAEVVLLCVPAVYLHDALTGLPPGLLKEKTVVSAIKGLVPGFDMVVSGYLAKTQGVDRERYAVISGPSHAEEVARERLSYLTLASANAALREELAALFDTRYIRTKASGDVAGIEYAAVLKNVMAIASGICHGLGYGDNFQAVLVSQAIREIRIFLDAFLPAERDITDAAYLGDLLVTSYSQFSRNRTFGTLLGKGYDVKFAQYEMQMVAEGYHACKGMEQINRKQVQADMPITSAVYNIIYRGQSPARVMRELAEGFSPA